MIDLLKDSYSLAELAQNANDVVKQLKETGQPMLLTVDGKPQLVVQDAAAYQRLLDLLDRLEAINGIRKGLESMARGEGIPADEAFEQLRQKHGIPG